MIKQQKFREILENKSKKTSNQFFKYFFAGGIAAILDISSFMLFTSVLLIDYRISLFFSFTFGTLTNFLLCNKYIFSRGEMSVIKTMIRHYTSSLGGLATNEIVAIILVEILNFKSLFIVKIIATIFAFIINFILIKFYAFNSKIK